MASALLVNPRKRKARKSKTRAKKSIRRRRNPARRTGMIEKQIMPAVTAGAGAVAINMAVDYGTQMLNLPAEWTQGNMRYLVEGASILGLGMVLENTKLIKDKKLRDNMIQGALTVTAYRAIDALVTPMLPGVAGYERLGGYQNVAGMGYQNTGGPVMNAGNRFA